MERCGCGAPAEELRRVLGYRPQSFGVYPNLTAQEFLEYMAAIKGLDSKTALRCIDELLQLVNLTEVRKRHLGGYSGSMKQRIPRDSGWLLFGISAFRARVFPRPA